MFGMSDMYEDQDVLTEGDIGCFIPLSQLMQWHTAQKQKYPQVYPPDDKLFGEREKPYTFGSKLKAYFNGDKNKPMHCEIVGSKWKTEFGGREPMYVIIINDELSLIPLTSAHEEGGWEYVSGGIDSDGEEDEDYDSEEEVEEEEEDVQTGSGGNLDIKEYRSFDENAVRHVVPPSASMETIQMVIDRSQVNDIIELPSGIFQGELEINKNLHFAGKGSHGSETTTLKCNMIVKQDECSGGKITIRDLIVQGSISVKDNTYDNINFISVEVNCNPPTSDAIEIRKCPGKVLLYCCEIIGGNDGLSLIDSATSASLVQTDISFARSRGIFANPGFEIKESAVYNCGSYGIKCRGGYTNLGGNQIQPGPWSELGCGY